MMPLLTKRNVYLSRDIYNLEYPPWALFTCDRPCDLDCKQFSQEKIPVDIWPSQGLQR